MTLRRWLIEKWDSTPYCRYGWHRECDGLTFLTLRWRFGQCPCRCHR